MRDASLDSKKTRLSAESGVLGPAVGDSRVKHASGLLTSSPSDGIEMGRDAKVNKRSYFEAVACRVHAASPRPIMRRSRPTTTGHRAQPARTHDRNQRRGRGVCRGINALSDRSAAQHLYVRSMYHKVASPVQHQCSTRRACSASSAPGPALYCSHSMAAASMAIGINGSRHRRSSRPCCDPVRRGRPPE